MGANPRIVTEEVTFQWDGVSQRLPKGQVLDVPPGSALEAAIGAQRLVPLGGVAVQPPAKPAEPVKAVEAVELPPVPEEEPKAAPAKPKAAAKDAGDSKDGDS